MKRDSLKKKKYIIISIAALLIFGFTVVFAMLNKELIMSGELLKKHGTWQINLQNVSEPILTGSAESYKEDIKTDGTTLNVYASLTEPGDSVTYVFSVYNGGTVNAKLSSYDMGDLSVVGSSFDNYNIEGILTYSDGTPLQENDSLAKQQSKELKLVLTYTGEEAITDEDIYFNLDVKLNYVQD